MQQYLNPQNYLWGDFAAAAVLSAIPITLVAPDAGLLANIEAGVASNSVPAFAQIAIAERQPDELHNRLAILQGIAASSVTLQQQDGQQRLEACVNGGHAAFPDGTVNAARVLLAGLLELEDVQSGRLTLNAGIWHSAELGTLRIQCDIRYPVTWRGEQIIELIGQQLVNSGIPLPAGWRDVAPFHLPADHSVISLLQQTWNDVTGREDQPYAMGGVTHSKVLPNAITFGPGYLRTPENTPDFLPEGHGFPHGADETIHLPSLLEALPTYVIALMRLDAFLLSQANG